MSDEMRQYLARVMNTLKEDAYRTDGKPVVVKFEETYWYDKTCASREHDFAMDKVAKVAINEDCVNETVAMNVMVAMSSRKNFERSYTRPATSSSVSIDDCFQFFTEKEHLDEDNQWFCPKCRNHVCAEKKMDIWSCGRVLVIQLKRFIGSGYSAKKLNAEVDFPAVLDMSQYITGPQKDTDMRYRLYAVSEHMGGLGGGHYTARAIVAPRSQERGNPDWYRFNDSSTSETSARCDPASSYVLFYEKIEDDTASEYEE